MKTKWTLRDWFNLIRWWDHYFKTLSDWPEEFRPELEDGTLGDVVMLCWPLRARRHTRFSWSAQLHKFVAIDSREPWHTHQASIGIRVILFGSYTEEVRYPNGSTRIRVWRKGNIGVIKAAYDHRIVSVSKEGAVSLWMRGATRHPVQWRFPSGQVKVLSLEEMQYEQVEAQ